MLQAEQIKEILVGCREVLQVPLGRLPPSKLTPHIPELRAVTSPQLEAKMSTIFWLSWRPRFLFFIVRFVCHLVEFCRLFLFPQLLKLSKGRQLSQVWVGGNDADTEGDWR